jgi:hypothetical protein
LKNLFQEFLIVNATAADSCGALTGIGSATEGSRYDKKCVIAGLHGIDSREQHGCPVISQTSLQSITYKDLINKDISKNDNF